MIRYLLNLICFLIIGSSLNVRAQVFTPLGAGFDLGYVRSISIDTVSGTVYAAGNFLHSGTKLLNSIGQWNGSDWDSLGSGSSSLGTPIHSSIIFQGNLVVGGGFLNMGGTSGIGIGLWNGSQWINIGDILSQTGYGGAGFLNVIDGELYALGTLESVNGISADKIAKWDGNNWDFFPDLDILGYSIFSVNKYNNQLYVGGNFVSPMNQLISSIARYDGLNWMPVMNGFTGTVSWVSAMAIFQGELYAAGVFYESDGNPGNNIARWDGFNWLPLGTGVNNGGVSCMEIFNNELYIGGNFTLADGIPVSFIVRWNGNQFIPVPNANFSHGIVTMAAWNNDLYIGGGFIEVNGMTVNRIVKYSLLTSINDNHELHNEIKVYPTVTTGLVTVEVMKDIGNSIDVIDVTGKIILSQQINENSEALNISNCAPGIYVVKVITSNGTVNRRIVLR